MNDPLPPHPLASSTPGSSSIEAGGLEHLASIRVSGADARTFLDAQLTRNVPSIGDASLAGYCSPKGRLLAIFLVWSIEDAIHLVTTRDVADAIVKRLRMYVLRAKAVVEDVTASQAIRGSFVKHTDAPLPWTVTANDAGFAVHLPDAHGQHRVLHVSPREGSSTVSMPSIDATTWRWSDIVAGIPSIVTATQDRFVPQMVNLEALGGVDFRKGCFPGQEVVARSQYLGKLKRRTAIATLEVQDTDRSQTARPGDDVWVDGAVDPQGTVVDAAPGPNGRIALLVELPVSAMRDGVLTIGSHDGTRLALEPLPYALPDNEVFVRPKL